VIRAVSLAIALVVLLPACAPTADSLSIHRFSASAENEFPPLDRTVTDATVASGLYEEVRALRPQSTKGTVFCGLDFGVRHELSIFAHGDRILHGVMQMGCHVLDLGAGDVRTFDDRFEADLLGVLGLYTRGNDLWPTPIPRP
jgi:hypothetical protein